jgi:hypothetical protein
MSSVLNLEVVFSVNYGRPLEPGFHTPESQTKYETAFPEQLTETDN